MRSTRRDRAADPVRDQAAPWAQAPIAVVALGLDSTIRSWNKAAERLYGWSESEALGHPIGELIPTDRPTEDAAGVLEAVLRHGHWEGEVVQQRKDGTSIRVVSAFVVIKDGDENPVGALAVNHDVTYNRQAEEALAEELRNRQLLSASAIRLLGPMPSSELFSHAAEQLRVLAGDAIILVNEYEPDSHQTVIRALAGPLGKLSKAEAIFGRPLVGLSFPFSEETREHLVLGRLVLAEGGVSALSFNSLPPALCEMIEQELDLGDCYAMPFVMESDFLGTVAIMTDRVEGLKNWAAIESVVDQIALALKRDRAEDALRESERETRRKTELFENMLASAGACVAVLEGPELRFTLVNPAYQALVPGLPMLGRTHSDVFPRAVVTRKNCLRVLETGEPWLLENFCAPIPGKPDAAWDGEVVRLRQEDAEKPSILAIVRDVTERAQAEEELRASEESRRLAADAAMVGTYSYDFERREGQWSAELKGLMGLRADEPLPLDADLVYTGIHPEDREAFLSAMLAANDPDGDGVLALEYRVLWPDGSVRWLRVRGRTEFVGDGENRRPSRVHGAAVDVNDRREAEDALRRSEEQLRQSQKMEAVGQLAGGIAHDFNNLLTAVTGYSDLLLAREEIAGSSAREDVYEIKAAASRASALTQQILAFSRRQAMRPMVVSLNDVLAGMEPLLRRTLGENIDVVCLKDPELGQVEADVHQFEQVLMNLAVNARDAMVAGGQLTLETANIELDEGFCRTHPESKPGSYVGLAVSDTGAGMDEATLERIFEPFFTTKAPGAGTGLGLAMVYGIVKQSGGIISARSEPGRGTSFTIYLPRTIVPEQGEAAAAAETAVLAGDETILVVEDEAALRRLVARILGDLGYRVVATSSGAEALEAVRDTARRPDLLLTDVVLSGGMQGDELARELLSLRPDLPVLFVSGYARETIVHQGRLDQGVNFLEKPFAPHSLATTVRAVLDQAQRST